MNFYVLTLFPQMIEQAASNSILGRAIQNGFIGLDVINIRDYSANRHMRIDDYPYGGGAGMVMEAEPVYRSIETAKKIAGDKTRVVYLTPQAKVLNQLLAQELSTEENLILLCGHYEGIDERVLEESVTDYVSIGDYVLTGGELPALVLMDAVSRFVPGVLSNDESSRFESLQDNLLEYPQYTRPEVWHNKEVPSVLLSGDHEKIKQFRYESSLERTTQRRPDLLSSRQNFIITAYGKVLKNFGQIIRELSEYPVIIDLNRSKYRKMKIKPEKNDAFVFFTDKPGLFENENEFKEIVKNLEGDGNPVTVIVVCEDVGLFTDSVRKMTSGIFSENNLNQIGFYVFCGNEAEEEVRKTAIAIKRLLSVSVSFEGGFI